MVSKDECSRVTFMEMSLSAAGAAQVVSPALPSAIAAARHPHLDPKMTKPCDS